VDDTNHTQVQTFDNPYQLATILPGIYKVKSVIDNYCSSTNTSGNPELIIHPTPSFDFVDTEIGICPGSQNFIPIQFNGSPPFNFTMTWNGKNPVSTTTNINPYMFPVGKPGVYKITEFNDNFCLGNPASDSVIIFKTTPPKAKLPKKDIPLCEGQTTNIPIQFKGDGPWTFTYTLNGMNPLTMSVDDSIYNLLVSFPGEYELTALSDANCISQKIPKPVSVVQYPVPVASFSYVIDKLVVYFTNESENADQYLWLFGDGTYSSLVNPVHYYKAPGNYYVKLRAVNEFCGYQSYGELINLGHPENSVNFGTQKGILDQNKENGHELDMHIYPNPNNGLFTLKLAGDISSDLVVEVISMTGQILLSLELITSEDLNLSGEYKKQIDISSFARGIYQVQLRHGDKVIRQLMTVTGE